MRKVSINRLHIVNGLILVLACTSGLLLLTYRAQALSAYERLFQQNYQYSSNCAACHIRGGGSQNTNYGRDFLKAGANLTAFERIAEKDSDGDGFINLDEIRARSNPGDSKSTPDNPGQWISSAEQASPEAEETVETKEGGFELELAQGDIAAGERGLSVGPISNISFGGLLDLRYIISDGDAPNLMIHVNELVITANITDDISLLLEQLLPTSKLISLVEDDHGFATAIISNIPVLPVGTALKIGRYRYKYGVDARLDAPANPLYPLVRRNLGFISDLGIELSGFLGPVSYYASVLNGPDHLEVPIITDSKDGHGQNGEMNEALGTSIVPIRNNSKPVAIRLAGELPGNVELGISYFEGRSWPYMNGMHVVGTHAPGGAIDKSRLIFKRRFTADASYRVWKLDILGEANYGKDYIGEMRANVQGYYGRVDLNLLPRKLVLSGQYDFWDDGLEETGDEQTISGAATYYLSNQVFIRAAYAYQKLQDSPRPNTGTLQLYLPY